MKAIHIFKPGTHTAMSGATLEFSETDLSATAAAYNPAVHEAPIVVGHPKTDAPAYGWISSLQYGEDGLMATPHQVNPEFAEMVEKGSFKKVSASFYPPNAPSNPMPGKYYLRHVGFFGGHPPSIKGLKRIEFGDDASEAVEIEFSELSPMSVASMFRSLREWLIAQFGTDAANTALPGYQTEDMLLTAARDDKDTNDFSETEDDMKTHQELAAEQAKLAEREKTLAEQEAAFAERETKITAAETAARKKDIVEFAEKLTNDGKLLPRDKDGLVAFMESLPAGDKVQVLEFGEGSDAVKKPAQEWFTSFMEGLPKAVEYGEVGAAETGKHTSRTHVAPGFTADPDGQALHEKALAYSEQHKVDYVTAVIAIENAA